LSKTLWPAAGPGSFTCSLPSIADVASPANILSGASVVGGVFAASKRDQSILLDFCCVGAADLTLVVEIGKLHMLGAIAMPLASVSIKSMTNAGTIANVNPFTGLAVAATTFRLFDLAAITALGKIGQVVTVVGGAEDDTPAQLALMVDDAQYYYAIITSISTITEVVCVMTPSAIARVTTKALP
jgi:hypothetical protein